MKVKCAPFVQRELLISRVRLVRPNTITDAIPRHDARGMLGDGKRPNHGKSASLCAKCHCILLLTQAIYIDTLGAFHYDCFPLEPHPDDLVFDLTVDDEDDEAHSTKRPRPEETHRCPNCKATVNDLQNIHVHEGEIFHEACYLDRVRKSKMAAPPTCPR
jgi:hypothetical protein